MSSLADLHSELDEQLNINSDDSNIDYRYYTQLINNSREAALKNELNRNRTIDDRITQSYCVSLEEVDPVTCCDVVIPDSCKLLRTTVKLPELIELHHSDGIINIKPVKITLPDISYVSFNRLAYLGTNRNTKMLVYAFKLNGYLYMYSANPRFNLVENIFIRGIFSDPTELSEYTNCNNGKKCFSINSEYPISRAMWQTLVKPQVIRELSIKLGIPLDEENNAKDDTGATPQERK